MDRVLAHERIRRVHGLLDLAALVISVHQLELYLTRKVAERVTRLDRLEDLDATAVIATGDRLLGRLVGLGDVLHLALLLVVARAAGESQAQQRQRDEAHRLHDQ